MKSSIPMIIAVISVLVAPVACGSQGNSGAEDQADTGQTAQQGDTVSVEEIDRIIQDYLEATDSLATIFERVKSVGDIDEQANAIRAMGERIEEFNQHAVRINQPLLDRMETVDIDTAFERLRRERERIHESPEMATRLKEVEGQ